MKTIEKIMQTKTKIWEITNHELNDCLTEIIEYGNDMRIMSEHDVMAVNKDNLWRVTEYFEDEKNVVKVYMNENGKFTIKLHNKKIWEMELA